MDLERLNAAPFGASLAEAEHRSGPESHHGSAHAGVRLAESTLRLLRDGHAVALRSTAYAGDEVERNEIPTRTLAELASAPVSSLDAVLIEDATAVGDPWLERAIGTALRAVKAGGSLVIVSAIGDGSRSAMQPRRTRIVAALQAATEPGAARIERIDADAGADAACLTIIVRRHGERARTLAPIPTDDRAEALFPFKRDADAGQIAPGMRLQDGMLVRDFGRAVEPVRRILLLQLAHYGDFIIALPAMRDVRIRFPSAHIRLVCGHWNVAPAGETGLFDEIRAYDYFPQQSRGWNGVPVEGMAAFAAATDGRFDIAVDLRVDEDTRHLLARVDAALRCGIGSQRWYPGLDVALPTEHSRRASVAEWERFIWLAAERFTTRLRSVSPFRQGGQVTRAAKGNVIYGPYVVLQPGEYRAWFDLSVHPSFVWLGTLAIRLEVVRDGDVIQSRTFRQRAVAQIGSLDSEVVFDSGPGEATFEFRVHVAGHFLGLHLDFRGVRLDHQDRPPHMNFRPRFRPVEVHIGEQLSLLVALIHARAADLYDIGPSNDEKPASQRSSVARAIAGALGSGPVFVIATGSNSTIRNWPLDCYIELIRHLLRLDGATVVLVGAPSQAAEGAVVGAAVGNAPSLIDATGRTNWIDLPQVLRLADLVICNNSGVAHQAASLGRPTLGIYSGSHQPPEWGPRGPRSRAIMAPVRCSPCGLEVLEHCEHGHVCMTAITPEVVLGHVHEMLAAYPPQPVHERCDPVE